LFDNFKEKFSIADFEHIFVLFENFKEKFFYCIFKRKPFLEIFKTIQISMQTKYAMENLSLKFSKQLKIYADNYK
jgi:hypothetical protein